MTRWLPACVLCLAGCSVLTNLSDLMGTPAPDAGGEAGVLAVTSTPVVVVQGAQATATISVTRPAGNDETVTLVFTSVPPGVSFMPSTPPVVAGQTSVAVTIAASAMAAQGTAGVQIAATTPSGLSGSGSLQLSVIGAPGTLDQTFGDGGVVRQTAIVGPQQIGAQSDGKLVVCGSSSDDGGLTVAALWRLDVDGTIDATFGTGGAYVQPAAAKPARCDVVHVNGDDTILFGDNLGVVRRLTASGALDSSYGDGGAPLSTRLVTGVTDGPDGAVTAIIINTTLARTTASGAVDTQFADAGFFTTTSPSIVQSVTWAQGVPNVYGAGNADPNTLYLLQIGQTSVTGTTRPFTGVADLTMIATVDGGAFLFGDNTFRDGGAFVEKLSPALSPDLSFGLGGNGLVGQPVGPAMLTTGGALFGGDVVLCAELLSMMTWSAFRVNASSGVLDQTFGNQPPLATVPVGGQSFPIGCVISAGKLVMAGYDNTKQNLELVRLWL